MARELRPRIDLTHGRGDVAEPSPPCRAAHARSSACWRRRARGGAGGLIFGFATVNEQAIAEGIDILARVIGEL